MPDSKDDADNKPSDDAPAIKEMRPTPRSAPALAFLNVTQDTATISEVPASPPFRRTPFIVAVVVVVALVLAGVAYMVR